MTTSRMRGIVAGLTASLVLGCIGPDLAKRRDQSEFHYKLSNGHFYANEIVLALTELQTCLKLAPEHPDAHHLMGFIFFGRKEYARAERHFRKALAIRGGFHQARANLGAVLLATRRWREAVAVIQPLVEATLYPTPAVAHNNLGIAWQNLGRFQEALKEFKLAIFHNPKFCKAYTNLGVLHHKLGHNTEALEWLEQAAAKCVYSPDPHYYQGLILEAQGHHFDARLKYMTCFKNAPDTHLGRACKRKVL